MVSPPVSSLSNLWRGGGTRKFTTSGAMINFRKSPHHHHHLTLIPRCFVVFIQTRLYDRLVCIAISLLYSIKYVCTRTFVFVSLLRYRSEALLTRRGPETLPRPVARRRSLPRRHNPNGSDSSRTQSLHGTQRSTHKKTPSS